MTDSEYIEGFRNNDERIIGTFYNKHRSKFFAYFRNHYDKSIEELNDLFQDSCVAVWQNVRSGKFTATAQSSLETYLFAVGKYKMMAQDRKYKEMTTDNDLQNMNLTDSSEETVEQKESRLNTIEQTVRNFPSPCSDILIMHYWKQYSNEKIAEEMGYQNTDTVKTKKYKCMQRLKNKIQDLFA